eukprot:scaffold313916_cov31-Tisochrysis_lutea.AAC.1
MANDSLANSNTPEATIINQYRLLMRHGTDVDSVPLTTCVIRRSHQDDHPSYFRWGVTKISFYQTTAA